MLELTIFHQPFEVARPLKNEPRFSSDPSPGIEGARMELYMIGEAFSSVLRRLLGFKVLSDPAPNIVASRPCLSRVPRRHPAMAIMKSLPKLLKE